MAEPQTHAAGLRAQCGFGAFCKPGNFFDRGAGLRMRAQFFLFSFGVFTANALLDLLSHNMLLIWESALLASCYDLSIINLASHNAYPRRPERTRKRCAGDRQHRGFRTLPNHRLSFSWRNRVLAAVAPIPIRIRQTPRVFGFSHPGASVTGPRRARD
jgi:hypothetical protein